MTDLTDQLADLRPELVAALGAVAGFLVVLAIGTQLAVRRLRAELHEAEEELVDEATGLLPRSALRVRLGAEIAWARTSGTPISVAALRIRGTRFTHAAQVLRHAMREEEGAFLLGEQRVAVELWDADPAEAAAATRRLGDHLARAGHPVVDAGIACSPRDGADVETLLAAAQRDLRPVDDPTPPGRVLDPDGHAPSATRRTTALLLGTLPWFASAALLLLVAWRLVPRALEPVLGSGAATRSGSELAIALVTAIGLPIGAALVHATCWNLGGGPAPASRPATTLGARMQLAIALAVGLPLAWGVFAPEAPDSVSVAFGASLAVVALVVLALVHARQLVHVPAPLLVALAAIGAGVTWLAVEQSSYPVVANCGRLLLAAALGALLATLIERVSWIVALALLAGGIDAWSVFADAGVSRQLLEGGGSGSDRIVDLLVFTAPSVSGTPLFGIGVTDLVFIALFLAWSHDWRLDVRVVAGALIVAAWAALVTGEVIDDVVPVLPFLAVAILLLAAVRSLTLRGRVRAWRGDEPPAAVGS